MTALCRAGQDDGCECTSCVHNAHARRSAAVGPDLEGRFLDPVTGVRMPKGSRLVPNPNRAQRRRLEAWRRSLR